MRNKIYVGNLSYDVGDDDLKSYFGQFGGISDAIVLKHRETGRSRGFGFVTYSSAEEAEAAVKGANNQELEGRTLRVNIARDSEEGGRRSGSG